MSRGDSDESAMIRGEHVSDTQSACLNTDDLQRTERDRLPAIFDRACILAERLIHEVPMIVLVLDVRGRIAHFNPYMEQLTGRRLADVRGANWFDMFLPAGDRDRDQIRELYASALTDHEVRDYVKSIVACDGREIEIEWNSRSLTDVTGAAVGIVAVGKDVTDQSHVEAQLRAILDTATDGIISIDDKGIIESFNRAAEKMFGYRAEEALGQNVKLLMPPQYAREHDGYLARHIASSDKTATGRLREVVGMREDGSVFPLELSVGELDPGASGGFTGIVRDISARKRLEHEFLQAQKMEAIGRLAAGVAHDFNNLLMGLIGCADIALNRLDPMSAARPFIEELKRSATTGASLTRQLLTFSRRREVAHEPVALDATVTESQEMIARLLGEDIEVRFDARAVQGWVLWDRGEIEQVLMNLAINSRDAMPRGGRFSVETRCVELDSDAAPGSLAPGPYLEITVADTGCGLDEQTRAFLFEPFFTTKPPGEGTGLGLSSVYGMVVHAGGHIDVDGAPDDGARFRVLLPRIEPPPPFERARTPLGAATDGSLVLVVEDEALVRLTVRHYLERSGYRVIEASRADEAVEIIDAALHPVDLLITDIVLPGGSGPELAATLAERRPKLGVLFMSAYTRETLIASGRLAPDTTTLQKPFTEQALLGKVREVLSRT